jgi:uncharacterized protein YodC (DUF2158 family)
MSDEANKSIPPEPRKIAVGDQVQLKGGEGPKMIVNRQLGEGLFSCVRWDKDSSKFRFAAIHRDALAYFGDPPPPGRKVPITQPRATIETAIRNGRHLLSVHSHSHDLMLECFNIIAAELVQHVDIQGGNC